MKASQIEKPLDIYLHLSNLDIPKTSKPVSTMLSLLLSSQDTRLKLFNDYMDCGEDFAQVEVMFKSRLEESQKTTVKYGFRNDQWLIRHHGEKKAAKIMTRKKALGLNLGVPI